MPALTHEDPQQLREKTLRLIDELQPSNEAELDQVCQAARLTLAIERAERLEMAHMNQRIFDAAHTRAQEVNPRLLEDIQELGRRLLYIAAAEEVKVPRQPLWADDPRLLVARLEASAEGCRWLLARWAELRILLDRRYRWDTPTLLRCIRLQGKQVAESVYDPALNVLFVAWDVLVPKFAVEEWENFREERFRTDPSFNHRQRWREIVARPPTEAEAWEVLYTIIDSHVENLNELLAANEAREAVGDDGADRAALDLSPGFERLRRYQSAKTRELQRTLETLCKLRKAEFGRGNGGAEKADGQCPMTDGTGQMADGTGQMADEECQVAAGELPASGERCEVEVGGCDEGQSGELTPEDNFGPVVGQDSDLVTDDDSRNDKIGILSHEGIRGDAVGQCLPDDVTAPQNTPNEANLESTQSTDSQEVESQKPEPPRRERSQFAGDGRGCRVRAMIKPPR